MGEVRDGTVLWVHPIRGGGEHEWNSRHEFMSLAADFEKAMEAIAAYLMTPGMPEEERQQVRDEFLQLVDETRNELRERLAEWEPNLDRILSPH